MPGVFDVLYHACMHGGSRPKWQRGRTNIKGLDILAAQCDGSHPHLPWKPFFVDGARVFSTAEEA